MNATATKGQIVLAADVEFEVTVAASPTEGLSAETVAALEQLMERAKGAALQVLNGESPIPASLAAAIARLIEAQRALHKARLAASDGQHRELPGAVEAFNAALTDLQTRFEEEFPHDHA